jgi:molecular chaperone DnaK (HSP70)
MAIHWGIDLGTSNTTVCEDRGGEPHIVNLPDLAAVEPLTQTPVIPSCVCIMDRRAEHVLIGQQALDYNWDGRAPGYASRFKAHLGRESGRPLARVDGRAFTAREVAALFMRELTRALEDRFGEKVGDVTLATPSGSFETYRAELRDIVRSIDRSPLAARLWARLRGRQAGIRFRTVDEPVAAALGYGVDVGRAATLVAFDFGAGSLEAAAIRTRGEVAATTGRAEVLAKEGLRLGGDDVDRWILDALVPRALHDWPEWEVALRWEAERSKLLASAGRTATFSFRNESWGTLDHATLGSLLAERGLYAAVRDLLGRLLEELHTRHGLGADDVDDVLLEGGSTLLPGVRDLVADVFGRDRVREWLPFESVARGACLFARGGRVDDFIYHDYAVRVRGDDGRDEYELLIPRGTRYPTGEDHVTRYYAPGFDGQDALNLFVCEVGRVAGRPVDWTTRRNGNDYFVPSTEGERAFCPCLNEADPALPLRPAGSGTAPRLRVSYMVDENRWLSATVHDLERKVDLLERRPVVRLR